MAATTGQDVSDAAGIRDYAVGLLRGRLTRLRPLQEDDLPLLTRWWNTPGIAVLQQQVALPQQSSTTAESFRSWSTQPGEGGFGYSIVNDADELVGHVAVWGITPTPRIGTLGIIIGPEHAERGYGTDATLVAL